MRTLHYLIAGSIVAFGLGLSSLVLPGADELALISFRDQEFDLARQAYERRVALGDLSGAAVTPLTQLYLQYGDVNKALDLMERYVAANPNDTEARKRLGKFYQYGQRPLDYTVNLEKVVAAHPTEAGLRELADIYNFTARYKEQIATLRKLIKLFPRSPDDLLNLAYLQASQRQLADAADTLMDLQARYPATFDIDRMQLLISLLLDSGQIERAAASARDWLRRYSNPQTATRLAGIFHFKGHPREALAMIHPWEGQADQFPPLLAELVQLRIRLGQADQALELMTGLFHQKRLPSPLAEPLLDLLLARRDLEFAMNVARNVDLSLLPDRLLVYLAETALAADRADFTAGMVRVLGEGFLDTHPVLGASLALSRSDVPGAHRWISLAEKRSLSVAERVTLANLYVQVGRKDAAIGVIHKLAGQAETPNAAFVDLANLYLETGRTREGLQLFEDLRRRRRAPEIQSSWALLAAASGYSSEALEWLRATPPPEISTRVLTDLYFISHDGKAHELAVVAAQALHRRQPTRENRLRLASSLTEAGRPLEALPHLRDTMKLQNVSDIEDGAYLAALSAAHAKGAPVAEELRLYWSRKFSEAGISPSRGEEILFALLDLKAYETTLPKLATLAHERGGQWMSAYIDVALKANRKVEMVDFLKSELARTDLAWSSKEPHMFALLEYDGSDAVLPFLRQFAEKAAGNWIFAYQETAEKMGRSRELVDFWKQRIARQNLSLDERTDAAMQILGAGNRKEAEQALMLLGGNASPRSRVVSQLLFIWGARPPEYALGWIETRARSAPAEDVPAWIEHLLNSGATTRAADVASGTPHVDLYLRSLVGGSDGTTLSAVLTSRLPAQEDPKTLRRWARQALEVNETNTARLIFLKLVSKLPDDVESLQWLGALSFAGGHYLDAKMYLSHLFALSDADYESHFYYGEALLRDGERIKARQHHERAFQMLERAQAKPPGMRAIRAQLLDRLGRTADSIAAFESLLAERPEDKHLRADFATILIRSAHYQHAGSVLNP